MKSYVSPDTPQGTTFGRDPCWPILSGKLYPRDSPKENNVRRQGGAGLTGDTTGQGVSRSRLFAVLILMHLCIHIYA